MSGSAYCPPRPRGVGMRALASVVFGLVFGSALVVLNRQDFVKTMAYALPISLLCWLFIDGGRWVTGRLLHRLYGAAAPHDNPEWPGWPAMTVILIVGSAVGYSAGNEVGDLFNGYVPENPLLNGDLRHRLGQLLFSVLPATAITYFVYTRRVIADREAATQAAQRQATESRLKLLETQLEPHMLFNTLANLRVLIATDPGRAQQMLDQLIGYLRSTLSGSRLEWHSLRAEFDLLADYLALMQVRMGSRLETSFDLPSELADLPVPPLLLQPLVENSIRHGLEPSVAGGRIDVGARRDGSDLVLTVSDTGIGFAGEPVAGTSFGLSHVRERLATLYGARARLTVEPAGALGGTQAIVRVAGVVP